MYIDVLVRRAFQTQTLSAAYGADLVIPVGASDVTVTLSDPAIGFTVQDQAAGAGEEGVPAGSSWALGTSSSLAASVTIKIKSASGTPVAMLAYFLPVAVS
mgnify:CR=1 FL=1|tara:strand:+ start:3568 stop:3870 length:303 start_codon:yes stop_codon:yes gene_type:complete